MEDIRRAKALGLNPSKLIKNVPGPNQRWKAPVKVWIRELYEMQQSTERHAKDDADHEGVIHDWQRIAEPINDADIKRLADWVDLDENGFIRTYREADRYGLT